MKLTITGIHYHYRNVNIHADSSLEHLVMPCRSLQAANKGLTILQLVWASFYTAEPLSEPSSFLIHSSISISSFSFLFCECQYNSAVTVIVVPKNKTIHGEMTRVLSDGIQLKKVIENIV